VLSGNYPVLKDLAFVIPTDDPDPLAYEFMAFVFSADGQKVIRESGYVPLEPPQGSLFAQLRAIGPPDR
jgi:ABC-type phosphate transport system substrate-binding protein